jgi:hypothetical protein
LVGVSRRREERRTEDGVAGDIGAATGGALGFRLGVGLDGVERSIWATGGGAAAGFLGEDLRPDLDLDGVAERSISPAAAGEGRRSVDLKWRGEVELGFHHDLARGSFSLFYILTPRVMGI